MQFHYRQHRGYQLMCYHQKQKRHHHHQHLWRYSIHYPHYFLDLEWLKEYFQHHQQHHLLLYQLENQHHHQNPHQFHLQHQQK